MRTGIDSQIQNRIRQFGNNPEELAQRYQQNQELIDLLALQKLKSEKERAAQEMQMQMQTSPQTIKDQREQELNQLTQQEVAQQVGIAGPLNQQKMQQEQIMQAMQGQGIGSIPSANLEGMAQGGIVAFQEGGSTDNVPFPRGEEYDDIVDEKIINAIELGASVEDIALATRKPVEYVQGIMAGMTSTPTRFLEGAPDTSGPVDIDDPTFRFYKQPTGSEGAPDTGSSFLNRAMEAIAQPVFDPMGLDGVPFRRGAPDMSGVMGTISQSMEGAFPNTREAALEQASAILQAEDRAGPLARAAAGIRSIGPLALGVGKDALDSAKPLGTFLDELLTGGTTAQIYNELIGADQPELAQSGPAQSGPAQSGPAQSELAQPELAQPEAESSFEDAVKNRLLDQMEAKPNEGYSEEELAQLREGMDPRSRALDRFIQMGLGAATGASPLASLTRGAAASVAERDRQRQGIEQLLSGQLERRQASEAASQTRQDTATSTAAQLLTQSQANEARAKYYNDTIEQGERAAEQNLRATVLEIAQEDGLYRDAQSALSEAMRKGKDTTALRNAINNRFKEIYDEIKGPTSSTPGMTYLGTE